MCGGKHHKPASDEDEDTVASNAALPAPANPRITFFAAGLQPPMLKPSELLAAAPAASEPIVGLHRPDQDRCCIDCRRGRGRRNSRRRGHGKKIAGRGEKARCRRPKPRTPARTARSRCQIRGQAEPRPGTPMPSRMPPRKPPTSRGQPTSRPKPAKPAAASPGAKRTHQRSQAGRSEARRAPHLSWRFGQTPSNCRPAMRRQRAAACHRRPHCSILPAKPSRARNEAFRGNARKINRKGKYHGAHLAQAISGRRARRYRCDPVLVAGRAAGRKLCEIPRSQGLHLHGQVDQLPRSRRDVAGARRPICRARACRRAPASR